MTDSWRRTPAVERRSGQRPVACAAVTAGPTLIRTFGCQMNEHDSERIAGLLEADGLVPAASDATTPTSSCSTPAASGRTPTTSSTAPRPPQVAQGRPPRPRDRRRRLPGPEGPRPHPASGPATSTSCSAPTTCTGPSSCCTQARAAAARSPRSGTRRSTRPSRSPRRWPCKREVDYAAWVTIQIGCDNSLRLLHRARRCGARRSAGRSASWSPRSSAWPPTASIEVTLLGQNVNSYGRDLTTARRADASADATSTRVRRTGLGRRSRPSGPAAVRRPARRGRRASRASAGSATPARTPRTCGPRPSPPWPTTPRSASTSTSAAVGQRPHAGRDAPGLHRRALPREAGGRPGRHRRPGRHHRPHRRASPARPTTTSSTPSRSWPRPSTTAPTPSSTRRGPAPRRPSMADRFVDPRRGRRALRAAPGGRRALGAGQAPRPASAASRRSSSRARASEDPAVLTGRTRQNKLRALRRRPIRCGRAPSPTAEVTSAGPHFLRGELLEVTGRASPPHPHPRRRRLSDPVGVDRPRGWRPSDRHLALVGPTASGKSALALELARRHRDVEIVSVDSMQVYRGMDIGTAKPTAAEQAEVPPPPPRPRRPDEDFTVARFQQRLPAALRRHRGTGRPGPAGGRHRPVPAGGHRRSRDPRPVPGRAGRARGRARHRRRCTRRLAGLDPLAASRMEPTNRRRVVRALEVTSAAVARSRRSGPVSTATRRCPFPVVGLDVGRDELDRRIERALRRARWRPASSTRSRRCSPARRPVPHRPPGPRLRGAARPPRATAPPSTMPSTRPSRRTRRFARRQQRWFRRDPRIDWLPSPTWRWPLRPSPRRSGRPGRERARPALEPAGRLTRCASAQRRQTEGTMQLTKHHGLGNDFLVALDEVDGSLHADATLARRLCDRRRGIGADGLIIGARPAAGQAAPDGRPIDVVMHLFNADGSRAEMSGNGIRCLGQAAGRGPRRPRGHLRRRHRRRPARARGARRRRAPRRPGAASTWAPSAPGPDIPDAGVRAPRRRSRHATVDMGNPAPGRPGRRPRRRSTWSATGSWLEEQFAAGINVEFIALARSPTPSTCWCGSAAPASPRPAAPGAVRRGPRSRTLGSGRRAGARASCPAARPR